MSAVERPNGSERLAAVRRNGNGEFTEDQDWLFLDNNIALAGFIKDLTNLIIEISDEPEIIRPALKTRRHAETIICRSRAYRQRLRELKAQREYSND